MSKKITGAEYPLHKIFSSDFDFIIPAYQRPYAWTVDQASELFDDLYDFYINENEDNYFLGSIVLVKEENEPASEVIDGQQRLTTLTILLAVLASFLDGDIKKEFECYIKEPGKVTIGIQPKPRLKLRDRDNSFFYTYIQSVNLQGLYDLDSEQLENDSQRNIKLNAEKIKEKVLQYIQEDLEKIIQFGSFIVKRCFIVAVSTPNQQSAFRIFSVLNSRGLDLLPTDIIKSELIGKISADKQDEYTKRWEDIEVETGRNGFAELFGHIRMIYSRSKAQRSLLEEFKKYVISSIPNPEIVIDNVIEPYSEAYIISKSCQYLSTINAHEINDSLRWLNKIDNSDWMPVSIQFLDQKKKDSMYVAYFFKKLERLAAYLHLSSRNINERIERYARILLEMQNQHSLSSPLKTIELHEEEKRIFKEKIAGKVYEMTSTKKSYLLLRLDSFINDSAATYNPSILTIEHVLPQTVESGSEWEQWWPNPENRERWVHCLGNLVPLNKRRNSKARNFDFQTKKNAYFTGTTGVSSYALTTQVLNHSQWDESVVAQRQTNLVNLLIDKWELS